MKETQKRVYTTPEIQVVNLDNEISLQLASGPIGPGEGDDGAFITPEHLSNDPYKMA